MAQPTTNREQSNRNLDCRGAKEEDNSQETFLNLINQSMQESEQMICTMGRPIYKVSREKALQQVAMFQAAKEQFVSCR